jgi:predicted nucleic acid-binding protein
VASFLIDTNILLRFVKPDDRDYLTVQRAVERLWTAGEDLCYTPQNLTEFWNTCSRPTDRNGFGLPPAKVDKRAREIERHFRLLEDNAAIHSEWRKLVMDHLVSGAQVYDARLVAAMIVHGIPSILTFNGKDFARYSYVASVSPGSLV